MTKKQKNLALFNNIFDEAMGANDDDTDLNINR